MLLLSVKVAQEGPGYDEVCKAARSSVTPRRPAPQSYKMLRTVFKTPRFWESLPGLFKKAAGFPSLISHAVGAIQHFPLSRGKCGNHSGHIMKDIQQMFTLSARHRSQTGPYQNKNDLGIWLPCDMCTVMLARCGSCLYSGAWEGSEGFFKTAGSCTIWPHIPAPRMTRGQCPHDHSWEEICTVSA